MARTRRLDDLIADVRSRVNMETETDYVSDSELTEYLNQELAELYGRIVAAENQPHFRSSTNISVTAGIIPYVLPSDFWRVQRVTCTIDNIVRDLEPFMEGERADLANTQFLTTHLSNGPRYRIQAGNIEFLPPTRTYTAVLYYTRACPRLVDASDTTDGFNGWEVAAIYGTCAIVLQKDDADPSFYVGQKERILKYIDSLAAQRDASHPERVTDVTGGLDYASEWWCP
jgi:hypothetical protein